MIDEKKLIAEMEKLPLIHGRYDKKNANPYFINGAESMYEMIRELVERQPKVDEWIPCIEKLPENDYDTVLVFLDSKIYDIAIWHSEYGFRPWYAAHFEASPPEWKACVAAWMPLPEPWKGDLK